MNTHPVTLLHALVDRVFPRQFSCVLSERQFVFRYSSLPRSDGPTYELELSRDDQPLACLRVDALLLKTLMEFLPETLEISKTTHADLEIALTFVLADYLDRLEKIAGYALSINVVNVTENNDAPLEWWCTECDGIDIGCIAFLQRSKDAAADTADLFAKFIEENAELVAYDNHVTRTADVNFIAASLPADQLTMGIRKTYQLSTGPSLADGLLLIDDQIVIPCTLTNRNTAVFNVNAVPTNPQFLEQLRKTPLIFVGDAPLSVDRGELQKALNSNCIEIVPFDPSICRIVYAGNVIATGAISKFQADLVVSITKLLQ